MERLALEFSKLSRKDLEKHDKIVESLRWNKKHRKNIEKDWARHQNALKEAAENLLEQVMDQTIEKFNKEIEFLKQEKQLSRISQEKNEKNEEYLARVEEKQRILAEKEAKKEEETRKKEEERVIRSLKAKNVATTYKQNKNLLSELEKSRLREENSKKQKILQSQILKNKSKVAERQTIQEQKILDRLEDQET